MKAYLDSVILGFRLYLQPLFALRNGIFFLRKSLNGTLNKRCLIRMLHPPVAHSVGPPEIASCLLPPRSAAQPELPPKHNHDHIHYITAFICYIPSSNPAQLMLPQNQPPPSFHRAAPRIWSSPIRNSSHPVSLAQSSSPAQRELPRSPKPAPASSLSLLRAAPRSGREPLQKHFLPPSLNRPGGWA